MDFYNHCKTLFDAGKHAEFVLYCRESMAVSMTRGKGWYGLMHNDFVRMAQSPMGHWIMSGWDGKPEGYMHTVDGVIRWINHPVSLAA